LDRGGQGTRERLRLRSLGFSIVLDARDVGQPSNAVFPNFESHRSICMVGSAFNAGFPENREKNREFFETWPVRGRFGVARAKSHSNLNILQEIPCSCRNTERFSRNRECTDRNREQQDMFAGADVSWTCSRRQNLLRLLLSTKTYPTIIVLYRQERTAFIPTADALDARAADGV